MHTGDRRLMGNRTCPTHISAATKLPAYVVAVLFVVYFVNIDCF